MPKLHQVTIPHSVFAELQNFLAAPDSPFPPKFRLTLTTLLAAMIGRIRLFQSTEGGFPNVLEWQIDAETRASDFRLEPASLVSNFEPSKYAIEMLSSFQSISNVDLFVDLSVDPSDRYLSIDLTTEPVLEGQDLATLAAASARKLCRRLRTFIFRLMISISRLLQPRSFSVSTSRRLHAG